jgi:P pilus assembly chaperone PapD
MRFGKNLWALGLVGGLGLASFGTPASAGSLQVDPIKVEITAERKIAAVRVKNESDRPVTIRGYALSWSQRGGEDVHEEAANVVVSPPIATIAPGSVQLIRVGLRSASANPASYRLMVEEVPEANPGGGVQVALRLSMPLYAFQKEGKLSDIRWSASQQPDGRWALEASNTGSGYVRVESSEARNQSGLGFASEGLLGTILPKSSRKWVLPKDAPILDRVRLERIARGSSNDSIQTASKL